MPSLGRFLVFLQSSLSFHKFYCYLKSFEAWIEDLELGDPGESFLHNLQGSGHTTLDLQEVSVDLCFPLGFNEVLRGFNG